MIEDNFDSKAILDWGVEIFQKAGLTIEDSKIVVDSLIKTSLWGIDSHGIARIPHYLNRIEKGSININPQLKFIQTAAATSQLDGDDGHGIVIMTKASEHAIELAKTSGAGIIGIQNSSHCGAIGLYTRQITEAGMVGIAFTHSDALVIPEGGKKAFFGTNPISIAFPTENKEEPICVDMATSIIPWNFIMNSRLEKTTVPAGLGVDADGNESANPEKIVALKPLGGHKGYALAFLIDMLCGPLNGMPFGTNITSMYKDLDKKRSLGSLVIAIDPERFGGKHTIQKIGTEIIKQVKRQGEKILYPGEPEYIKKYNRLKNGIPISSSLILEFSYWSERLGVKPL